ncbi:MAG: bifunctional pyr operon transcriptional regulator/uracil phosphoribosyltransferase PyrR [Candidatus Latescibacteria bacterium]|nr:bifunctional pyr operon transcriptional regulator/uracil phosphoribosyltransferase PyrR [Candidatus Latescibacterota bacterium]
MTASSPESVSRKQATVMNAAQLKRALVRMAHEIIEESEGAKDLALVGMQTRGVDLARRLAKYIGESVGSEIPVGVLDVTLYRDDFRDRDKAPVVKPSDIPFEVDGRTLVLVDDVLFTGRTVRAALDSLMDYGRPSAIHLAVLIDRGHRQLPISADFVGQEIRTLEGQEILVRVKDEDGEDAVYLVETPG